jgi:tape measure domain-containing protein
MAVDISGGGLNWTASIDNKQFTASIKQMETQMASFAKQGVDMTSQIDATVKKTAVAIGSYLSLTSGTQFVSDMLRVRGEFQQLQVSFETMLQSKAKADALFQEAVNLAAKTPLELKDVGTATKQLLAYGFQADNVIDTVRMLGDVASATGTPLQDISYLYGTLQSQGRAYAMDIRQFAGRGIPIIGELAKQFGVSAEQVNQLVEAGKVGFPEVERAFKSLTSAGGIFNNMMEAQSGTIMGQIAKLSDAWNLMLNDIGKGQEGFISDVIETLTTGVENYQEIIDVLKTLVAGYGSYKAAVIAATVVQSFQTQAVKGYTIAETLRYRALLLSEGAMRLFNKSMIGGGLGVMAAFSAGVAALTIAMRFLQKEAFEATSSIELLGEAQKDANSKFADQSSAIKSYVAVLSNQVLSEKARLDAYKNLKEIAPDIIGGLDFQRAKTTDLTDATNAYIAVLRQQINLESKRDAYAKAVKQREEAFAVAEAAAEKQGNRRQTEERSFGTGERLVKAATEYGVAVREFQKSDAIVQDIEKDITNSVASTSTAIQARVEILKAEQSMFAENSDRYKQYTKDIDGLNKQLEKQIETEKGLNKVKAQVRNKSFLEFEITRLKNLQEPLAVASKGYKDLQAQIEKLEQELSPKKGRTEKNAEENSLNAVLKKRTDLLQSIADFERDAKQSGLLKQQTEIDKISERYEEQVRLLNEANEEIEKYNKRHQNNQKALLGDAEVQRLQIARDRLLANEAYQDEADKYIELSKRKSEAFQNFQRIEEQGNTEITEKAREMYDDQMGEFDTYLEYLQSESKKVLSKVFAGQIPNNGDSLRLDFLSKEGIAERNRLNDETAKKDLDSYGDLLKAAKTYTAGRVDIEKKYNKLFATLSKERLKTTASVSKKELDDREELLQESMDKELQDLEEHELEKYDTWKKYKRLTEIGLDKVGKDALKGVSNALEVLKKDLDKLPHAYNAVSVAQKSLGGALNGDGGDNLVKNLRETATFLNSTFSDLQVDLVGSLKITMGQITKAINDVATLLDSDSSTSNQVGSIIGLVSFVIVGIRDALLTAEDLADPLQAQIDYYSQIHNEIEAANFLLARQKLLIDDLAGANKIDASLDYMDKLNQKEADVLNTIKKLQVDVIKSQQEVYIDPIFNTQVSTGGLNALASTFLWGGQEKRKMKIELETVDTSTLNTIEDFANLLAEIKAGGGKLNGKVVVEEDIKALELLINTYDQLQAEQKALKVELQKIFTGTTAESISDGIIDGFRNGLHGAKDFAKNFEELMTGAVLNSLKYQALEEPLKAFYEQFAQSAASDSILTENEIGDLRNTYDSIIAAASQQFENLKKVTNLDLTAGGNESNSLKGAIKGITEQQAELLAGQFGGMRTSNLEILKMATAQLSTLNDIRYNTAEIFRVSAILGDLKLNGIRIKP